MKIFMLATLLLLGTVSPAMAGSSVADGKNAPVSPSDAMTIQKNYADYADLMTRNIDVVLLNGNVIHINGIYAFVTDDDGKLVKAPDGNYLLQDHSQMNVMGGMVKMELSDKIAGVTVHPPSANPTPPADSPASQ